LPFSNKYLQYKKILERAHFDGSLDSEIFIDCATVMIYEILIKNELLSLKENMRLFLLDNTYLHKLSISVMLRLLDTKSSQYHS
jgi:hypothetical protein